MKIIFGAFDNLDAKRYGAFDSGRVNIILKSLSCNHYCRLNENSSAFVSQHLRLKRSSLLNVHINCKFEIILLSSYFSTCSIKPLD